MYLNKYGNVVEQIFVLFYNKESSAKLHTTWKTIKKTNFVK